MYWHVSSSTNIAVPPAIDLFIQTKSIEGFSVGEHWAEDRGEKRNKCECKDLITKSGLRRINPWVKYIVKTCMIRGPMSSFPLPAFQFTHSPSALRNVLYYHSSLDSFELRSGRLFVRQIVFLFPESGRKEAAPTASCCYTSQQD